MWGLFWGDKAIFFPRGFIFGGDSPFWGVKRFSSISSYPFRAFYRGFFLKEKGKKPFPKGRPGFFKEEIVWKFGKIPLNILSKPAS